MVTKINNVSDPEKIGKMRIRLSVMIYKISTVTNDFFITHSHNVTDQEWSQLIDKIVDIVNTQRS